MRNVWLIGRHEFRVTVGRTSFRLFAAVVPVLAALTLLVVAVFQAVTGEDAPDEVTAGFVDFTRDADGQPIFQSFLRQDEFTFVPFDDVATATRALLDGQIDRLYLIPGDYLQTGVVHEVTKERAGLATLSGAGTNLNTTPLGKFLLNNLFVGDVGTDRAQRVLQPFVLTTTEIDDEGNVVTDPVDSGKLVVFLAIGVLLIISVFTTSGYLLQGLNEEKENRIMEVLLSSVRPEQLMAGKLAGLGAAGLTQMAIWTASGIALVFALDALAVIPSDLRLTPSDPALLIAVVYFVLGYFLFGALMAALGAVTTSQREAGQVTFLIVLPGVAPLWFMQVIAENPEGTLARALTFVPFTAPLVGLLRLGVDGIGPLELAASIVVLAAAVALVLVLTLRLFQAYLLMYGQRPALGQILRTLRGA